MNILTKSPLEAPKGEPHYIAVVKPTVFEVVINGRVFRVDGGALQRWIVKRRAELKGPKGYLFSQRPMLE